MGSVFDLAAKITLDYSEFKSGLSKAGKAIGTFAKVTGAAVAAGTTAVGVLVKQSVNAYADYEQLSGGVKKLFGNMGQDLKDYAKTTGQTMSEARAEWAHLEYAQNRVLKNAEQAYITTGMSANEYIENVTGISAALVNSYGGDTVKAAQQADKAMRAISDNFNTFGGDINNIKNAFQGFAKQNYTMLDNLKLGYGGTKTEMQRLIADANEYREELGLTGDLTIEKYGDVVEAIDLIQQKQNIAGTTAREAASTISGSLNMTKAAWKNLVRAFGDKDADLTKYFDNLLTSAETAFDNILPVAEQAINGISTFISDAVPKIGEKLPGLIQKTLPGLVKAGTSLVTSLITGFASALPILVSSIPDIIKGIKAGFVEAWPALKEAGGKLMEMVGEGVKKTGRKLREISKNALDKIAPIAADAWDNIKNAAEKRFPGISELVSRTWSNIKDGIGSAWNGITSEIGDIWSGLQDLWGEHGGQLSEAVGNIWDGVKEKWTAALDWWDTWGGTITDIFGNVWDGVKIAFSTGLSVLADVFAIFAAAFAGDWQGAWENVKKLGSDAWNGIKGVLGKAWNSIATAGVAVWTNVIAPGLSKAWDGIKAAVGPAWENIKGALAQAWDSISSAAGEAFDAVVAAVTGAWNTISSGVSQAWSDIQTAVVAAVAPVIAAVSGPIEGLIGTVQGVWSSIEGGVSGAWAGIKSAISQAIEDVKGLFNFGWSLPPITLPKLPSLSVTWASFGGFSYPKLSWNAKAMNNPWMFSGATLFGAGEAGDEVLYGKSALMGDIGDAVEIKNTALERKLDAILAVIDTYLPEIPNRPIVLDTGELVGGIGNAMDRQLGAVNEWGGRELSLA